MRVVQQNKESKQKQLFIIDLKWVLEDDYRQPKLSILQKQTLTNTYGLYKFWLKQQFNLRTNLKLVTIKIFHILSFLWLFYKNVLTLTFNLSFSFLSPMNPVMVWLDHRDLLFLTFPGTSILLSIVTGLIYIATPSRATFLSYIWTTLLLCQFKKI